MAASSDIGGAIVATLKADPDLVALVPGGVYFDEAPADRRAYVLVSLIEAEDVDVFGRRAWEEGLYAVRAVMQAGANGSIRDAAARIDALLDGGTITAPGFTCMGIARKALIRFTERDETEPTLRFWHRGGEYLVSMAIAY